MKTRIKASYNRLRETRIFCNLFNLGGIQLSNIVLLFLTIRLVNGVVGIAAFGIVMFANRFSLFAGTVINYGTNQSAVRDVAYHISDRQKLRSVLYNTLWIRTIVFALYILVLTIMYWLKPGHYRYILYALPLVLAEVVNPLCFYLGFEKLRLFNVCNLIVNIFALGAIALYVNNVSQAVWVNFILGTGNFLTYSGLLIYLANKHGLALQMPKISILKQLASANFYLTVNNVSVNLQQSLILFALAEWSTPGVLGAYSICDRIIGQCRNLLITISNALYPNAVHIYKQSTAAWNTYRRKTKYMLAGLFMAGAFFLILMADPIIYLLSKEHNQTAVLFLRIMAVVPVVSALNVLNVLDQLLKKNNLYIFRIAAILFIVALATVFVVLQVASIKLIGTFTLIIELCALLLYEFAVTKPVNQDA